MIERDAQEAETRAQIAEKSRLPVLLKIARGAVWVLYAIVVINLVMLGMAFVLRLAGASTDASFVRWVYRNSDAAMRPFRGIFPSREVGENSVLDTSLLFAAVIYIFVALGVDALLEMVTTRLHRQEQEIAQARTEADALRRQAEAIAVLSAREQVPWNEPNAPLPSPPIPQAAAVPPHPPLPPTAPLG